MTSPAPAVASSRGTGTAVPASAPTRRASRSMSWAPGGVGGGGGRRTTTWREPSETRKVRLECPSPIGRVVTSPRVSPRTSRKTASFALVSGVQSQRIGARSLPGEAGRALLLERGQRLGHVRGPGEQRLATVLQLQRRGERRDLLVALDRALGHPDATGRVRGDQPRQRHGLVVQAVGGNDAVGQPDRDRLRRAHDARAVADLGRPSGANQPAEVVRRAQLAHRQPDLQERGTELCRRRDQADVGRQRERQAAAGGRPVDRGDDREGQVPDRLDAAARGLLELEELANPHPGDHVDLVEVEARAERALARPGEDERAQPAVPQRAGGQAVLGEHPHGLGVHPLRAVDPEHAEAGLGHLEGQRLQLGEVRACGRGRRHRGQAPVKTAGRFSLNAASASGMSALRVSSAWPRFSSSSAAAYDEISRFACNARLDSCTPPGEFATIASARASTSPSSRSGSLTRLTSPIASASSAATIRPVKQISLAWAGPISRVSSQDAPRSPADRPIRTNAALNFALDDANRMSAASASCSSSSNIVSVIALYRSGRFRVTTTTPGAASSSARVSYSLSRLFITLLLTRDGLGPGPILSYVLMVRPYSRPGRRHFLLDDVVEGWRMQT